MHVLVDLGLVFTTALPPKDTMTFRDEGEISYALGKQGGTRKKLERASGESFGKDIDVP